MKTLSKLEGLVPIYIRHSLWILGNERTFDSNESIWKELVCDARNHNCLFNVDECLKTTIVGVKKELDQLDDLAKGNSVLFKDAKWKVMNLLLKLSNSWNVLSLEEIPKLTKRLESFFSANTDCFVNRSQQNVSTGTWNFLGVGLHLKILSNFVKQVNAKVNMK